MNKFKANDVIVTMEGGEVLLTPVDCGMDNLKSLMRLVGSNGQDKFQKFLYGSEVEKGESITGETTYINGEAWNLGGFNGDSSKKVGEYENVFTKDTEYHRALMRRYLYELYLQTGKKKFELIVGASVDNYHVNKGDSVVRNLFEVTDKNVDITGRTIKFKIQEGIYKEVELEIVAINSQPETASALLSGIITTSADQDLYLCDLGGLNNTVFVVRGRRIDFTTNGVEVDIKGMLHINKYIAAYYNRNNLDKKITVNRVEQLLRLGKKLDKSDEQFFQEAVNEYMQEEFMPKLKARGFDSSHDKLEFIGGGAVSLSRFIKKYCKENGIVVEINEEEAMFATVKGMLRKVERAKRLDISKINGVSS
jgi:hypothetical protein